MRAIIANTVNNYEYYVRGAAGQIMATYRQNTTTAGTTFDPEFVLYGAARLGTATPGTAGQHRTGLRRYELTDHLASVRATVSDRRKGKGELPTILSATDYYPFGMSIKSRSSVLDNSDDEKYRFGFGGQQKSTEINAQGNSYTAQFWQYDARTGRRLNGDPVVKPWQSGYSCFDNNPLLYNDPKGLFASEAEAQKHADDNGIKTGWWRDNKITENKDKTWSIDNKDAGTSISNDAEYGIQTAALVTASRKHERHGIALTSEFNGGTDAKGIAEKTVNIDLIAVGAGAFNPGISSQFTSAWNYLVASAIKVVEAGYEALGIPDDVDAILPDNTPESQIKVQTSNDVAKRVSVDVIEYKIMLVRIPNTPNSFAPKDIPCTTRVSTADTNGMNLIRKNDSTYFVPDNDLD